MVTRTLPGRLLRTARPPTRSNTPSTPQHPSAPQHSSTPQHSPPLSTPGPPRSTPPLPNPHPPPTSGLLNSPPLSNPSTTFATRDAWSLVTTEHKRCLVCFCRPLRDASSLLSQRRLFHHETLSIVNQESLVNLQETLYVPGQPPRDVWSFLPTTDRRMLSDATGRGTHGRFQQPRTARSRDAWSLLSTTTRRPTKRQTPTEARKQNARPPTPPSTRKSGPKRSGQRQVRLQPRPNPAPAKAGHQTTDAPPPTSAPHRTPNFP